jgi:hypothetical protein
VAPNKKKLYDYSPSTQRNERTRQDIVFVVSTARFLSIDSYYSDSPEPITIIYVEIDEFV